MTLCFLSSTSGTSTSNSARALATRFPGESLHARASSPAPRRTTCHAPVDVPSSASPSPYPSPRSAETTTSSK
eukprot:29555-Pelagococcus_subviridis.AAC.3